MEQYTQQNTKHQPRFSFGKLAVLLVIGIMAGVAGTLLVSCHSQSQTSAAQAAVKYTCPMHPTIVQDHPGDCPICGMKLVPMKEVKSEQKTTGETLAPSPAPATTDSAAGQTKSETIYTCPMDPQIVQDHPGKCPICGMDLVKKTRTLKVESSAQTRKIAYYRSPMDPKQTSPTPRKDEMGMDYVPVYKDELSQGTNPVEGRAEIAISPARQQLIGLKTAAVSRGNIGGGWTTVGRVQVDPTRVSKINVKVSGYVEHIMVDFVGQAVKRGDPIFTFYSPDLLAAEQEYLLALKTRDALTKSGGLADNGDAMVIASRHKLKLWDVPESEITHLEQTGEPTKDLTFVSPVSGVVTAKNVVEGASLKSGDTPYEITDLSTVWVMADAYQSDLDRVKTGMPATLKLDALPDRVYSGQVAFVDPILDPQSRTLKVRINFPNEHGELKPDMYGTVTLQGADHPALTIPADAVVPTGTRSMVFVSTGEGKFQPREVTLGAKSGDTVEVLAGLREGESVVTRANFLIDSESSLRAALSALQGS